MLIEDDFYSGIRLPARNILSTVQQHGPHIIAKIRTDRERSETIHSYMIPDLKDLPYEQRLAKTKLWSLEDRRISADLIEVYKIIFMDCLLLVRTHSLNSVITE